MRRPMAPKKRKGGIRQRVAAARGEDAQLRDESLKSSLAAFLIFLWSWGTLSPQMVQRIAAHAYSDVHAVTVRAAPEGTAVYFEDLRVLAGIGSSGSHSQHCNRDLMRILPESHLLMPQPAKLPFKHPGPLGYKNHSQYLLWPHEVWSSVYHHYNDAWKKRICPGEECCEEFWDAMQGNPQAEHPDILARHDYRRKCVPLAMHGDGVPVSGVGKAWRTMQDIFSWSSLLGTGSTLQQCFYIYALIEKKVCKAFGCRTYNLGKQLYGRIGEPPLFRFLSIRFGGYWL